MKTLHKALLIFLSFATYTNITQAMRAPSKKRGVKRIADSIRRKLLGKENSDQPLSTAELHSFPFVDLPAEMQTYIVELLARYSNSQSITGASISLRALSQTCSYFNKLINNTDFNEQLLHHLTERFGGSMENAAFALSTPAAKKYLNKHLIHLITSNEQSNIGTFIARSKNINAPLDNQENTALMVAMHNLAFISIEALLHHEEIDITALNDHGDNVLHIAAYKLSLLKAQQDTTAYVELQDIILHIIQRCKTGLQTDSLIYSQNEAGEAVWEMIADLDPKFYLRLLRECDKVREKN